eukprot:CAMPEP_0168541906 /NCGR_PEP_ID=MMETSP0413-20121227/1064_1 /TAXON_ID=136452 /ORGANISM="Filamoeba nolandi, Strain NC-AS-23-1" /LENGTH=123 /DNA_ID=CAMNT_0008571747 /DNA_START=12 /DNA_END=383 /DNA_ORIENTATION=+
MPNQSAEVAQSQPSIQNNQPKDSLEVVAEDVKKFSPKEVEAIKKIIQDHTTIEDGVERCAKLSKMIKKKISKDTIVFRLLNEGEELLSYWSYGITSVQKSMKLTRKATVEGKTSIGVYLILCY